MSEIFHLVYLSKAAEDISYSDIMNILEVSRRNNIREGITGVLIFRDGYFLQLLEGNQAAVHKILNAIRQDDRNYSLRVLIESLSERRIFKDWSMAFCDADITTGSTQHLIELFDLVLASGTDKNHLILPILKKFQDSSPELK